MASRRDSAGPLKDAPQSNEQKIIWTGSLEGFDIKWTASDLIVHAPSGTQHIFTPLVEKGFQDFTSLYRADDGSGHVWKTEDCSYERSFRVLSVVGTLVSFEDQYLSDCGGARPSVSTRYTTIDLSKPGHISYGRSTDTPMMDVDLSSLGKATLLSHHFAEEDILQALLSEPEVRAALAVKKGHVAPKNLVALAASFAGDYHQLGDTGFELRPDYLSRFAFHHVEGDKVAVQLGLPPHYGANKGEHKVITILLPIPVSLRTPLELARSRKAGFLMKDSALVAQDRVTKISLGRTK